jgi:acyl carrier protein
VSTESIASQVIDLASDTLEVGRDELSAASTLTELEQWDSLRQLNLLLAVEEQFGIELSPDDIDRFTSIEEIVDLVQERQG